MRLVVAVEHLGRAGGMERYLDTVLPALAARGADIRIVARTIDAPQPGAESIAWSDEHDPPSATAREAVEHVLRSFRPDTALAVNVMDAGVVEALRAAPRLVYQIHDHRPLCPNGDRVFPRTGRTCTAPLGIACAAHALTDGCAYGPRPATIALIRRRARLRDALARADAVMVASAYVAARARSCGVAHDRIVEVPPPLPDDAFAGAPTTSAVPAEVLFAGRLVPQKGLDVLVDALALLPADARPAVAVYGDGPSRAASAAHAARLDVRATFHGARAPEDVRAGMDRATLAVVPSSWAEPFGMVGIEAFARGRTVVAFEGGGILAWLRDRHNGLAVPPGTGAAGLAGALRELLADERLRARLAAQARRDAERYRTGPIVDVLTAALEGPR